MIGGANDLTSANNRGPRALDIAKERGRPKDVHRGNDKPGRSYTHVSMFRLRHSEVQIQIRSSRLNSHAKTKTPVARAGTTGVKVSSSAYASGVIVKLPEPLSPSVLVNVKVPLAWPFTTDLKRRVTVVTVSSWSGAWFWLLSNSRPLLSPVRS